MPFQALQARSAALGAPSSSRALPAPFIACSGRRHTLSGRHRASRAQEHTAQERAAAIRSSGATSTAVTDPAAEPTTAGAASSAADVWTAFAAASSGEWEGVTASFSPDASPMQLPEYYVPQAYRDWGVELFDWQSQSSMLADETGLTATHRRMMPTVGCEADAIAYTQEASQLFSTSPAAGSPTVAPDGSYSAGPADISAPDCLKATSELCLALPLPEGGEAGKPMRLRLVHNLQRVGTEGGWQLESVELHSERYDTPHDGKVELQGCGGGLKPFASESPLAADALAGSWEVVGGLRYKADPGTGQCTCAAVEPGRPWSADSLPAGLLLHPLRCWSFCSTGGEGGSNVSLAAGVLLDEAGSRMALAARRLVSGRLAGVELLTLQRTAA